MVNDKSSKTDISTNTTGNEVNDTDTTTHKNLVSRIMRYETGEASEQEVIELFQELINSGMAWSLQGHYGRMASHLIEQGVCNEAVSRNE